MMSFPFARRRAGPPLLVISNQPGPDAEGYMAGWTNTYAGGSMAPPDRGAHVVDVGR